MSADNPQSQLPGMDKYASKRHLGRRGSGTRVFGDLVDKGSSQLEVAPGAVDPSTIAEAKDVLARAALSHPNEIKTAAMLSALDLSGTANRTAGLAKIYSDGPDNPHFDQVKQYYGANAKRAGGQEALQRDAVRQKIEIACGACAVSEGCIFNGNPGAMVGVMYDKEPRAKLEKGIATAFVKEQDFDCMETLNPGSRDAAKERVRDASERRKLRKRRTQ